MKIVLFCKHAYAFSILRPIECAARSRGYDILWYIDAEILSKFPFAESNAFTASLEEIMAYAPDVIFVPGNAVPYFLRGVKVQVFHGFAGEKKGHFRIRDYFDLYLTQGPFFTRVFQQLARTHSNMQVTETGWSKLDPLFDSNTANGAADKNTLIKKYKIVPGQKVILYAPTFSPKLTSAPFLLDELEQIGCAENGNTHKILIKFHPLMDKTLVDAYQKRFHASENIHLANEDDLTPFLLLADVMISDTSSAVYEFLLLDKPVITLNTSAEAPRWCDIKQVSALKAACEKSVAQGALTENPIKNEYHPYTDGRSSERMLDAVENYIAQFGVPAYRKIRWWRRLKIRKSLW
jgi:CDP-ribitol ribitolphosphotransferase / teichoic acid ribitol-phosphate polymerase